MSIGTTTLHGPRTWSNITKSTLLSVTTLLTTKRKTSRQSRANLFAGVRLVQHERPLCFLFPASLTHIRQESLSKTEGQKQSQAHEKRLAKIIGGSTTAASGAFWSRKGDVRNDVYLVEHKFTGKTSFSLKSSVLEKVANEAIMDGRMPVLAFHLKGRDYVVLEEHFFHELSDTITQLRNQIADA